MADRLRVAVTARAVAPWHGRGGLERHVADLVDHLARSEVAVTLIVPPPRDPTCPLAAAHGGLVRTRTVPYWTFPAAGRRGTTILDRNTAYPWFGWRAGRVAAALGRAGAVDIVHGLGASVLGYALQKRRDPSLPPLVVNPQGLEEFGATDPSRAGFKVTAYWPLQRAVRACARAADAVIATDRSLAPVVCRHLGVAPDRVPVIPNAVDLDQCDRLAGPSEGARLRASRGLDANVPLLLSVGRVEENKGFHVLADALARLARQPTPWHWLLVGEGPFRPRLERLVRESDLGSRIMLAGRVDDAELHAWYEAADVFVHPTLYEGSSLVTLEAMAHRKPVVATRAGGLPDKVEPGRTGWLVPSGDADALTGALREAMAARDAWAELGAAGRRLVEREFSWPVIVSRLLALYGDLCRSSRAQASLSRVP